MSKKSKAQSPACMQVAAIMQSGRLSVWRCSIDEQGRLQGSLVLTASHKGKGAAVIAVHFVSATQRASHLPWTVELHKLAFSTCM